MNSMKFKRVKYKKIKLKCNIRITILAFTYD